jgi:hypothetical protein
MKSLIHYGSDVYGYGADLTWGLLRAAGNDQKYRDILHECVSIYYRYTAKTPQGNWRTATLERAGLPAYNQPPKNRFEAELLVQFSGQDIRYFIQETDAGRENIVMVPKNLKQPTIL